MERKNRGAILGGLFGGHKAEPQAQAWANMAQNMSSSAETRDVPRAEMRSTQPGVERQNAPSPEARNAQMERELKQRVLNFGTNVDANPLWVRRMLSTDRHKMRTAACMAGHEFEDYNDLSVKDLQRLVEQYPLPSDFTKAADRWIDNTISVAGHATQAEERKRDEYREALGRLCNDMYGERAVVEDMVNTALMIGRSEGAASAGEARRTTDTYRRMGESARQATATVPAPQQQALNRARAMAPSPADRARESARAAMAERRGEVLDDRRVGVVNIARRQKVGYKTLMRSGNNSNISFNVDADETCQDAYFVDQDKMLFAVFDGAGGVEGGREAAEIAKNTLEWNNGSYDLNNSDYLVKVLNKASELIDRNPNAGMSTGVIARLTQDTRRKWTLHYASIGDSRIYIQHKGGKLEQITKDEGYRNFVTNSLGIAKASGRNDEELGKVLNDSGHRGSVPVRPGDRIILVSDGVTGDLPEQEIGNDKISRLVSEAANPKLAAQALVANSIKPDDTTAIVAEVPMR